MEIRKRRKPPGAAAPPSRPIAPSVRMGPGGGGAPAAKRRRGKRTGGAAPPSFAPPPSARMPPGDGSAPTARRRKLTGHSAPPYRPTAPSVRMGPGGGGAPGERMKHPPSCAATPPSLLHLPSVCMARDDGDGDATRKRKRKVSSSQTCGKRGRRTGSEGGTSRNGSAGGIGGPESSGVEADGTETLGGEDGRRDGVVDDPSGGAGHTEGGSPDDPAPPNSPPENVAVPRGKISVAHTPNVPPRFEGLIRNITTLIPYESKGKSHECRLDQMQKFLNWCKSDTAFFFEWSDEKMEMLFWIHNIKKREFFKFTVNAAFSNEMDDISVQKAAVAFSSNFIAGNDECWSNLKNSLLNIFGSFEENAEEFDYLYVFTRVGDSVYFRNFKIIKFPEADGTSNELVLSEINTTFCLKLVIDQETPKISHIGQDLTKLNLCPVVLYSISNGQRGSSLCHGVDFSGKTYSILLENGPYISSLEKLEGFNRSLAEIVVKEPLLKVKNIIGSTTNKTCCFARQRCKSIFQSLFGEVAMLFDSGKCFSGNISMHNVLIRASEVKLYGLHVTDYNEELAKDNVRLLVGMVRSCLPDDIEIPIDLSELLEDLEKDPLNEIRTAKDDCSLLKAEHRRSLLININSDYMTNVEAKSDQVDDESQKINEFSFFDSCPDAENWRTIMKDNEYMVQVCNVEESSDDDKETDGDSLKVNASVQLRMKKKERVGKNTASIKRMTKKKKQESNNGKLQFSSKRNFQMHMPEKARKDGIFPFRLGMADYILTAYFPRFLRFVQKKMRQVKAQREKFKKARSY